jgi:hypothetical protein
MTLIFYRLYQGEGRRYWNLKESCRSHSMEKSLWERLWSCKKKKDIVVAAVIVAASAAVLVIYLSLILTILDSTYTFIFFAFY